MKNKLSFLFLLGSIMPAVLAADLLTIPVAVDTNVTFWQSSPSHTRVSADILGTSMNPSGNLIGNGDGVILLRFDLAGVSTAMTGDGFRALLDLSFQGFADNAVKDAGGAVIAAHPILLDWSPNAIWTSTLLGSAWTNGAFGGGDFGPAAGSTMFVPGWDSSPINPNAVIPNEYGSTLIAEGFSGMTIDVTDLVRNWVHGIQPNYGLVLTTSVGQVNFNMQERSLANAGPIGAPFHRLAGQQDFGLGEMAPRLLVTIPEPSTLGLLLGGTLLVGSIVRRRRCD